MTASNPTIRELLAEGTRRLQPTFGVHGGSTTPELDAEVLLAHILAVPRPHLRSHPEEPVGTVGASYRALLERRALGVPLAYLTGAREFWSLPLRITPAVLVPRPETELLVERALALGNVTQASIAELGTGSGAVALALASERPHWRVTAIELSPEALAVARANAEQLALTGIDFRQGSWFEPLAEERFDLILSNPPYIASDDPALDEPSLAHEPRLALTPGADALECLRSIAHGAPQHLRPGGWLLLEHGTAQGAALRNELVLAGLRSVRSHHDLAGHERVTEGQYDPI